MITREEIQGRLNWFRQSVATKRACRSWQTGRHIDTLPTAPAIPFNFQPVVVAGPSSNDLEIDELERLILIYERLKPLVKGAEDGLE